MTTEKQVQLAQFCTVGPVVMWCGQDISIFELRQTCPQNSLHFQNVPSFSNGTSEEPHGHSWQRQLLLCKDVAHIWYPLQGFPPWPSPGSAFFLWEKAVQKIQSLWHIVNISHPTEAHRPQFPVLNKNQASPLKLGSVLPAGTLFSGIPSGSNKQDNSMQPHSTGLLPLHSGLLNPSPLHCLCQEDHGQLVTALITLSALILLVSTWRLGPHSLLLSLCHSITWFTFSCSEGLPSVFYCLLLRCVVLICEQSPGVLEHFPQYGGTCFFETPRASKLNIPVPTTFYPARIRDPTSSLKQLL